MKKIEERFLEVLSRENVLINEDMKNHTTFQVGGPADYYLCPTNIEDLKRVLSICKEENLPYYVLGNGSNLLVGDKGYRGVIIETHENLNKIQIEGTQIRAMAGAGLSKVANRALSEGLTGMEFASGIPGSIGGACVMNAGAYGGEMKDILCQVLVLTPEGEVVEIKKEDMELGYRTSLFAKKHLIVLEATLCLEKGNSEEIKERMDSLTEQRTTKQPLEYPSAGSTFKRPEGYFAGKLIQDAGLSGKRIGGAMVSEKHNGFVINAGGATTKDITDLMDFIIKTVKEKHGVILEPEVKRLGEFI
ncbi:UDP-N-acetylmuramate dehydrogenase [Aequitasia blattaphilus]|uniref:UDP-N-acetylenolpyruvoylglucosamine reductase n=1 Tax=Aequitasia blattaphilus TaxID=2949332 RepID=A0ABT1EGS9_9FIRM|nr:UDP-N-acetylmuramate dehydrogenase [Aequitasia blattaphilus]MCP1103642.1 UDP-N-acetylmuramate dehydrogenase [Aequitasia blattaphilus]MCR8616282.1 UDP-N-acetylmuramate dehydrogenase [Aequitasia blattaphilus]